MLFERWYVISGRLGRVFVYHDDDVVLCDIDTHCDIVWVSTWRRKLLCWGWRSTGSTPLRPIDGARRVNGDFWSDIWGDCFGRVGGLSVHERSNRWDR